jgi:uncharacterized protein YjlB
MPKNTQPETLYLKNNGSIPNSKYPVLLYRNIFSESGDTAAEWLEKRFAFNGWTNAWRWGIYNFHHYHSNTHEVLGVFQGSAQVQVGGENGEMIKLSVGDIIVIPAGVGHKCIASADHFSVVGAYPGGIEPDLNKGLEGELPAACENIDHTALPLTDPLLGATDGLPEIWK